MDGKTGVGGVPAWLDEPLGGEEALEEAEKFVGRMRLCEEMPVREDKPAAGQVLGVNADMRIIGSSGCLATTWAPARCDSWRHHTWVYGSR
jgi:hypothetical protein